MENRAGKKHYTLEEYAALEKASEGRLEYFDGNVWSMAGASPTHEEIVANLIAELKNKLRGKNCRVFGSNLRVKVPIYKPYRYPDVTALCNQPLYEEFYGLQILTNPSLIVEVLSESTQAFDLGDKFTFYKSIETFSEYLLVAQERPHLILYTKRDEKVWLQREYSAPDETVYLSSMDCELSLAEIYTGIDFPETKTPGKPFGHPDFR